ncbi:hypothetical protein EW146_g2366 [Bondarzewia mesenterica]|uniref:non-specific serine/threonine protein kinase n=1 Tax=Bondarzewia mesenterica TaxID=1095465 RepID=A0A4S4M712_9AGAM|nr:hypothetical protein EW146_g2366 [Bondarzewia mesenterica]
MLELYDIHTRLVLIRVRRVQLVLFNVERHVLIAGDAKWYAFHHLSYVDRGIDNIVVQKCDGVRPVCGPCSRASRPGDCEYTDGQGRSRTQVLEENIAHLEARIHELENPGSTPPSIVLHDPHAAYHIEAESPAVDTTSKVSTRFTHLHTHAEQTPATGARGSQSMEYDIWRDSDEPPMQIAQSLLDVFFQHSSQLGWFLNITRFRHAILLPPGNGNRPLPVLISAVYLWGMSFSRMTPHGDFTAQQDIFLSRARTQLGHPMTGSSSHRILQTIQANVLLAVYLFNSGAFLEGRLYCDSSASLVMSCGLHRIRSEQLGRAFNNPIDTIDLTLPEPRDQVEEGEHINAFWTVFSMDRCWAVALQVPTIISDSDMHGSQIDTPWPLEMETYEKGQIYPNLRTSGTVRNFLGGINTGWPWEPQSLLAQISKASALFERATRLAACWRPVIPDINAFYADFMSLDQRIDDLKSQLFPLENLGRVLSESDVTRSLHMAHCLAHSATIQLHAAFAPQNSASRSKCLTAATAVLRANADARIHESFFNNPLLGTVWVAVCRVFIDEIVSLRSFRIDSAPALPGHEAEIRIAVEQLQTVMAVSAPTSALMNCSGLTTFTPVTLINRNFLSYFPSDFSIFTYVYPATLSITVLLMSSFLDLYDPLDIIGNGSFGIIRKVRRKSDGVILARKELNFERMSERDRKQIVAEVNILKDLNHEHIVRYHDRYVDREAGILYILMEYCGGGDLSTLIKQAQKHGRPIPEDTIWNYFMQILLALHHCHHPNGHSRSGSGSDGEGSYRRAQILHRDLKPDNVFLDENNTAKLGDFGLSKALAQASFANTYVGTPYYMSPELMQEKAYDSKSDIWSLGCLIYELCALKPPFHEAKTHSELSIFIRNARIPPLPRGYSQALSSVIKAMLNLNPAMRPSAAQLLQHERLELSFKVSETQKMLTAVKAHKSALQEKERDVTAREARLATVESNQAALIAQRDAEIATLRTHLNEVQSSVAAQIHQAISKREEGLRTAVLRREEEVAESMRRREEEIMEAVRRREAEVEEAWRRREWEIREECERELEDRLSEEWEKLENMRGEIEERMKKMEDMQKKVGKKDKSPLEEVKNILAPLAQLTNEPQNLEQTPIRPSLRRPLSAFETPVNRNTTKSSFPLASAMKGVILTETGETLATPTPAELAKWFVESPKGGLGFAKIFDFDKEDEAITGENKAPLASLSKRGKAKTMPSYVAASTSAGGVHTQASHGEKAPPVTRLRRPSIRPTATRPKLSESGQSAASTSSSTSSSSSVTQALTPSAPLTTVTLAPGRPQTSRSASTPALAPVYNLADEDNLPSPFLKRVDRERMATTAAASVAPGINGSGTSGTLRVKRPSGGNLLRAVAAANSIASATMSRAGAGAGSMANLRSGKDSASNKLSITNTRRAGDETRRMLSRA